ncbi:MAG: hypothetical protein OEM59_00365 [Rhodospirillales bacterium]|nr:hypothetical protein [Rhodospirillales bacterium]
MKLDHGTDSPRLAVTPARAATKVESGELGQADIRRAIDSIATLGAFYGRLANNDPNRHAAAFWTEMEAHYVRAGFALDDLLRRGRIRTKSLGEGRDGAVEGNEILIDGRLGGRWQAEFVRNTRRIGNDDWGYISLLSTVLLENLYRLEPDAGLDWFKSHQSRSGFSDAAKLPRESDLARLLARFWHLKDKYLWSAMAPAESEGERRLREGRKIDLLSEMMAVARDAERNVAADWKDRLTSDWHDYDRMVSRFGTNRAWLAAAPGTAPVKTVAGAGATATTLQLLSKEDAKLSQTESPERDSAAKTAEQAVEAKTEPGRETKTAVAAVDSDRALEEKLAQLASELESSRQETSRLEETRGTLAASLANANQDQARLAAELASARQDMAALQQELEAESRASAEAAAGLEQQLAADLEASREKAAETQERLGKELDSSRQAIVALREELEAERKASAEVAANLEQQLAADLEASREEAAAAEARLTEKLAASEQTVAALRQELEGERRAGADNIARLESQLDADLDASREEAVRTEERLTGELEASVQTIAALRSELEAERAASAEQAASLEQRLAAELDAVRQESAALEERLSAELRSSQDTIAALRGDLTAARDQSLQASTAREQELAAELDSARQAAGTIEQDLTAKLEASRQTLTALRGELAETRERQREETAPRDSKLAVDLEASEQTVAALREQIAAERKAAEHKIAGLEAQFTEDLTATQQTLAALREQLGAEREAAAQKLAGPEGQPASKPEGDAAAGEVQQAALIAKLETSRQETARLREQLVALQKPRGDFESGPWIIAATAMLLVIFGLILTLVILWRQRSSLAMPDLAAAAAGGATVPVGPGPAPERVQKQRRPRRVPAPPAAAEAEEAVTPQMLVEALRQGETGLFERRLARMADVSEDQVRWIAGGEDGQDLAVCCRALGIDKLVFASIYLLSQKSRTGGEELDPRDLSQAMARYDGLTEAGARQTLRSWQKDAALPGGGEDATPPEGRPPGGTRH